MFNQNREDARGFIISKVFVQHDLDLNLNTTIKLTILKPPSLTQALQLQVCEFRLKFDHNIIINKPVNFDTFVISHIKPRNIYK